MTTLIPRLYVVDKTTAALTPIDGWSKITCSPTKNDVGAVSVDIAAGAPGFSLLFDGIDAALNRDVEFRLHIAGGAAGQFGGFLQEKTGDDLGRGKVWTISGGTMEMLTREALIYSGTGAVNGFNSKKELAFSGATAGTIAITALQKAQARGAVMAGVTWDFSTSVDSAGVAWPNTISNISFVGGSTIYDLLGRLVELQVAEWELTAGRVLRMWAWGTRGVDRSTGVTPLRFMQAVNLGKGSRRESSQTPNSGTAVLAKGSEGRFAEAVDATAEANRGRRVEVAVDAGQIDTQAGVTAAAAAAIQGKRLGVSSFEYETVCGGALPAPRVDYEVADWALCAVDQKWVRRRISQYVLTFEHGKPPAVVTSFNDLVADPLVALYQRVIAQNSGGVVVGSTSPTPGSDTLAPGAPTGLTATSVATQGGPQGMTQAIISLGWTAPAGNTDGSAVDDIAGYRVQYSYPGRTQVSTPAGTPPFFWFEATPAEGSTGTTWIFGGVDAGVIARMRVAAYDTTGNLGPWSATVDLATETDDIPPPTPSSLVISEFNGVLEGRWDGLGSAGEAMPGDFRRCVVHLSTSASFTPSVATVRDELRGRGAVVFTGLTYGQTYYFRLVSEDVAGNVCVTPSATTSGVPLQLVGPDLADALITAAKIAAGAVTTPAIFPEAVTTAHLSVSGFLDTIVPNGDFEDPDLVTATAAARWSLLSSTGAAPAVTRDTTSARVLGGTAALKVSLPAASGSARVGSAVIPARPGDVYMVEIAALGSRAVSGALRVYGYFDNASPPNAARAGVAVLLGSAMSLGTGYAVAQINFTVPATVGAVGSTSAPDWMQIVVEPGLVSGDSAALDVWVDQLRLRKVVGTAEIANLAVTNAKIALLAVNDANIGNLGVGKLTAGTLTAAAIIGTGRISTGNPGQYRFEADSGGWRLARSDESTSVQAYAASGDLVFYRAGGSGSSIRTMQFFAASGDFKMYGPTGTVSLSLSAATGRVDTVGSIRTDVNGDRIVLDNVSSYPTIQFFDAGTTRPADYAFINGITIASGGSTYMALGLNSGPYDGTSTPVQTSLFLGPNSATFSRNKSPNVQAPVGGYVRVSENEARLAFTRADNGTAEYGYIQIRSDTGQTYIQSTYGVNVAGPFLSLQPNTVICGTTGNFTSSARFGQDGGVTNLRLGWNGSQPTWVRSDNNVVVKTFVIDHPTDPARHLVHATVESPEVTVQYSGSVQVVDGRGVVELPRYFETLTRYQGRVVQLTPVLDCAHETPIVVGATYPRDGRFTVVGPAGSAMTVGWLVVAVRADVDHLDPEPLRAGHQLRAVGPYTWLEGAA